MGVLAATVMVMIHMREQKESATRLATASRQNGYIQGDMQARYATRILHVQISNAREAGAACHDRLAATPGLANMPARPYEEAFVRSCIATATTGPIPSP